MIYKRLFAEYIISNKMHEYIIYKISIGLTFHTSNYTYFKCSVEAIVLTIKSFLFMRNVIYLYYLIGL